MKVSVTRRVRIVVAGAAVGVAGAILAMSSAGAQTPSVQPAPFPGGGGLMIACATGGPPPGADTTGPFITSGAVQAVRIDLAEELAKALGRPKSEIERALEQVQRELPPPDHIETIGVSFEAGAIDELLRPVATRLGVSVADLHAAMRDAAPLCPTSPPQSGPAQMIAFDATAHFAAIAAKLGRGITGEQVGAAFEASRPAATATAGFKVAFEPSEFVEALARALGISVSQLRTALDSIRRVGLPAPR